MILLIVYDKLKTPLEEYVAKAHHHGHTVMTFKMPDDNSAQIRLARALSPFIYQVWIPEDGNVCATFEALSTVINFPEYTSAHSEMPDPNYTELRSPVQVDGFMRTIGEMYFVHLEKNADYSPANIMGVGEIGLVTRIWDKVARLLSLTGFNITITKSSFEEPRYPKNESIDDTLMDLANYAIIHQLLRKGAWGN